ncbi:MAG: hypothetical protein KDB82_07180 [Planctomycetes bacterium]|nr:hypothetical protein [Planctomycetota bacterium]
MKYLLLMAACAVAAALGAQSVTYYPSTAGGYQVAQHDVTIPSGGNFSLPGGVDWDTGGELYYYDGDAHTIQRYDTLLNQPASSALYNVPNPVFGPYVDDIEFDPNISTDLFFLESGAQLIYKLRRSGLDTLDTTFGTNGVLASSMLPMYPYDLAFDGFSRLFCIGGVAGASPINGVYFVDRNSLAITQVVDLLTPAGTDASGPITFDSSGNLYVFLPPQYPQVYPLRIVRFSKASLDNAIAASVPLTVADGTMVVDAGANFPNGGRADFHLEAGHDVLYYTAPDGSIYRWDTASSGYTQFAFAAAPVGTDVNYPSAISFEQAGGFGPYSGSGTRLAVMMITRDASYAVQQSSLCIFNATAAPGAVNSLAITDVPANIVNGVPFRCEIELRDAGNALLPNEIGGVDVQILSGTGTLSGTTYRVTAGGVAVFDDLVLTGGSGSVILRFTLSGSSIVVDTSAVAINGSSGGGGGSSSSSGSGGCSTGSGSGSWMLALGLLAMLGVAIRFRRARA